MAAVSVLVVLTPIQSPKANTFSNLLCWRVYGFTSTTPSLLASPESRSS